MKIYHLTILFALLFFIVLFVTDYKIDCFEKQVYSTVRLERVFNKASYKAAEYYFKEGDRNEAYEEFCKILMKYDIADENEFFFAVVEEGEVFVMSGECAEEARSWVQGVKIPSIVTMVKNLPEMRIISGAYEIEGEAYLIEQRSYCTLYHLEGGPCIGSFVPVKRMETQKECAEEGAYACECVETGTHFYGNINQ